MVKWSEIKMSSLKNHSKAEIVFLNSVFPILSETFLFDQYSLLLKQSEKIAIVSSHQADESQVHPNMRDIQDQVNYLSHYPLKQVFSAHINLLVSFPIKYFLSLFKILFMQEKIKTSLAHISGAALVFQQYPSVRWFHSHFTYGSTAIAWWLNEITKIPYSVTLHGADLTFDNPPDLEAKLQNAAHIFSISQYNIDYIQQSYPKIHDFSSSIVPLGVFLDKSKTSENTSLRDKQTLSILNVGRLSEHKAQHLLIEACAILKENEFDFKCDIIGEGPKRTRLEQLIQEQQLEDEVTLLGALYHQDVMKQYSKANVFVLSSITEGMPLVIMEAMQNDLIVIAPDLSGIPELLNHGDTGILFEAGSVTSLVKQLKLVLNKSFNREEMRIKAKNHIKNNFNVEKNTLIFYTKLQNLINQHSTSNSHPQPSRSMNDN